MSLRRRLIMVMNSVNRDPRRDAEKNYLSTKSTKVSKEDGVSGKIQLVRFVYLGGEPVFSIHERTGASPDAAYSRSPIAFMTWA